MRRAMHAARHCLLQGAVQLVGAALPRDIAGKASSSAGKDVAIGLVQRKGHELGAGVGSFDQPRGRDRIGLAQIDEHDIDFCIRNDRDPWSVQLDCVDHDYAVAGTQALG